MKATQTPLFTARESPREAQVSSHRFLLRAGYIRQQTSGLYGYLPFGWMVHQNIERIIREEMNRFGGVEVHLPVMTHADIWKSSERWGLMGPEMIRLKDRHKQEYCLAPTHEEAITVLAKSYLKSHKQLPVNFYQIGLKYRDEIRPRYGLIRCREFTMKDAYSFHTTEACLDETYEKMRECYRSIFSRCGLQTIAVEADSGNMGGSASEEFMVVSSIGEATLLISENNGVKEAKEEKESIPFAANQDQARFIPSQPYPKETSKDLPEMVSTPDMKTVREVSSHLNKKESNFIKALIYENSNSVIIAFIPGDRELSAVKLGNVSGKNFLEMASEETVRKLTQAEPGFCGPYKLNVSSEDEIKIKESIKKVYILYDRNLCGRGNLVSGANKTDKHYVNIQEGRDFSIPEAQRDVDLVLVRGGDRSPANESHVLTEKKGIELGHIFKIGKKYTESLRLSVLDEKGKEVIPFMGCYGIGVGRVLQAFVEQSHDERGIIWSKTLTPYQIYLTGIYKSQEELERQNEVYENLLEAGFTVFFDDRKERPGIKFNDFELTGFPIQIIMGKSFLNEGVMEFVSRDMLTKKEYYPLENMIRKLNEIWKR